MRKALILGAAALVLSVQHARANPPSEQQWLHKLKQAEQSFGKNDHRYGEMLFAVGNYYQKQQKQAVADGYYQRALVVFSRSPGRNGDMLRYYSETLARVYTDNKQYDRAEPLILQAIKLAEALPAKEQSYALPQALETLGRLKRARGDYPAAETAIKRQIELRHKWLARGEVDQAKVDLAELYLQWGKLDQTKQLIDELLTMQNPPGRLRQLVADYSARKQQAVSL